MIGRGNLEAKMGRPISLDGIAHFMTVVETGSFRAAGVRLGISPSAVSQAVRALETRLGVVLLSRSTRSVTLTEAGTRYLDMIAPAMADLAAAQDKLGEEALRPSGKLRLNVQRGAHFLILQPILADFLATYPDIDVEAVIDYRIPDLVSEQFDAGIRFGDIIEKDMIGVAVGPPLQAHVLASPAYLAKHGTPDHPTELMNHDCIGYRFVPSGLVERWEFIKGDERFDLTVNGRLVFNDSMMLVQAALDGLGITYMVNGYVDQLIARGKLVRLLADWSPPLAGFKLYFPERHRNQPKLRALIDFLKERQTRSYTGSSLQLSMSET
jgi:DNA-binding transcriptional LysR family regulator